VTVLKYHLANEFYNFLNKISHVSKFYGCPQLEEIMAMSMDLQ